MQIQKCTRLPLTAFLAVILATALFAGLTSCGNKNSGCGSGFIGLDLNLRGQVHTLDMDMMMMVVFLGGDTSRIFPEFNGTMGVSSNFDTSGTITGGQLTIDIGRPAQNDWFPLIYLTEEMGDVYDNFKISPEDAQGAVLILEPNSNTYDILARANIAVSMRNNNTRIDATLDTVQYIYVDRDVTITGSGLSESEDGFTLTIRNLNLQLKEGWNAIHGSFSGSVDMISERGSATLHIRTGNPASLKWVLLSEDIISDFDDDIPFPDFPTLPSQPLFRMPLFQTR